MEACVGMYAAVARPPCQSWKWSLSHPLLLKILESLICPTSYTASTPAQKSRVGHVCGQGDTNLSKVIRYGIFCNTDHTDAAYTDFSVMFVKIDVPLETQSCYCSCLGWRPFVGLSRSTVCHSLSATSCECLLRFNISVSDSASVTCSKFDPGPGKS